MVAVAVAVVLYPIVLFGKDYCEVEEWRERGISEYIKYIERV